ncbi:MAG TPA: TonB family protein [Cytophagaceae bacterium]|jgi:protein TonB
MKLLYTVIYVTFFLITLVCKVHGQSDTIFYNEEGEATMIKDTTYYELYGRQDTSVNRRTQYYLTGEIYGKAQLVNQIKEGTYLVYYKNGTVMKKYQCKEGKYENSYFHYFEDGSLKEEGVFLGGRYTPKKLYDKLGKVIFENSGWYSNDFVSGEKKEEGKYVDGERTGIWKEYYKSGKIRQTGKYTNDRKDSVWLGYRETGSLHFKETYKDYNDDLKVYEGISYDSQGLEYRYNDIIQQPAFTKGNFNEFIASKLHYPKKALKEGISGKVFIEFVIEKDGSLSHIKIKKGLHPILDKVALDAVKQIDSFIPGMFRGQPVRLRKILPISFKMRS